MARLRQLEVTIAGERVVLRGDRSLYWPRERMLAVADLHVGKTESLRYDGAALPDGVMADDLARLSAAIAETGAERLIVIGDLVHDAQGLTPAVRAQVVDWRRQLSCRVDLILGNHDRRVKAIPSEWQLSVYDEHLVLPPFDLRHEPSSSQHHVLCGHLHPAIRLSGGVDGIRVPCFHLGAEQLVLPAFSGLTGGRVVQLGPDERAFAVVDGWVFRLDAQV